MLILRNIYSKINIVSKSMFFLWRNHKKEIIAYFFIFLTVLIIFSPLVKFGSFHHTDDFHLIRKYTPTELFQLWYSNYNFTARESNGYRPLQFWTYHVFYSVFGFNDNYFLFLVIFLDALYALVVYKFSRNFLERKFAIIAAFLTVFLPQTLFRFTFVTAIYSTILYGLIILSSDFLIKWYKSKRKKYIWLAIVFAFIASLYKESGYCMLLIIPISVFLIFLQDKTKKFRQILFNIYIWLSISLLGLLLTVRYFAISLFPEKFNPNYPSFQFGFSLKFFVNMFHSMEREVVAILQPLYDTFFKGYFESIFFHQYYQPDPFILIALPLIILFFLINRKIWKNRLISSFAIAELIFISIYLGIIFSFTFSLFLDFLPFHSLIFFHAYYYIFYILLLLVLFQCWLRKKYLPFVLLFIFLVINAIPASQFHAWRVRNLTSMFGVVIILVISQFIKNYILKNKKLGNFLIISFFGIIMFLFAARTIQYILVDNFKFSERHLKSFDHISQVNVWENTFRKKYGLDEQINYARKMWEKAKQKGYVNKNDRIVTGRVNRALVNIPNSSFEKGLIGLKGPADCSNGWEGEPIFSISVSDESTHGQKSLQLFSKNHIAGVTKTINNLLPRKRYKLSIDMKDVKGKWGSSVFLKSVKQQTVQKKVIYLAEGWERHIFYFYPKSNSIKIILYCKSKGKENIVLYDNIRMIGGGKEGIVTYLQYEFRWPSFFDWPLFESPWN